MNNVKLRLSLSIPGAQMLSEQECSKNPKESYDYSKLMIEYTVGKGKKAKTKKEILNIRTRKSCTVRQNINIGIEAYNAMIDNSCPPNEKYAKKVGHNKKGPITLWSTMSKDARLKANLDLIAESLQAVSYSYEVLED